MYKYKLLRNKEWLEEALKTRTKGHIVKEIGCPESMIRYYAKMHGISLERRKFFPILQNEDWLKKELETKSQTQISEEIGCNRATVQKAVSSYGLKYSSVRNKRPSRFPPVIKFPLLQNKEWLLKELETKSKLQIAEEMGASYSAVTYMANKYGIEVGLGNLRRPSKTRSDSLKKALKKKYPEGRLGDLSPNWKGGIRKNLGGKKKYVGRCVHNHPFSTRDGCVMEHRLVMEKHLGRYLKPDEIVHHRDSNPRNNDIKNLELTTKKKHFQNHFNDGAKKASCLQKENEDLKALLIQNNINPEIKK